MDYAETYGAVKAAFLDALSEHKKQPRLMRIEAFDAEDADGEPVRVVGIIDEDDGMRFVVIEEDAEGEIYPIARSQIFRKGSAATNP